MYTGNLVILITSLMIGVVYPVVLYYAITLMYGGI